MKKIINIILITCLIILIITITSCSNNNNIEPSKSPFPEFKGTDMNGNIITNDIFTKYDVTIVNFWNNGCGTCIQEMPELEDYYQEFKNKNINLIGIGTDSGDSDEKLKFAKEIIATKGVTYTNFSPDKNSELYKKFIPSLAGYPTTFIVDKEGNIIGNSIVGNVKKQDNVLRDRIDKITRK